MFGRPRHIGLLLLQWLAVVRAARTPIGKPIIVIAWLDVSRDRE